MPDNDPKRILTILDILMPRKAGLTAFEELRTADRTMGIPIIMLTSANEKLGFGLSADDLEAHYGRGLAGKGPELFMEKPPEPGRLVSAIRDLVGGSSA